MTQLVEIWNWMNQESLFAWYALRGLGVLATTFGLFGIFVKLMSTSHVADATSILSEWLSAIGDQSDIPRPPRGLLIDMCMPPDRADDVINNLLGRYNHWVEKHGARSARTIFFLQSAGSILTFWTDWLMKRLKLLKTFVSS